MNLKNFFESQIRLSRSQQCENQNLRFRTLEIQFKIRDLRLYYSTVQLLNQPFCLDDFIRSYEIIRSLKSRWSTLYYILWEKIFSASHKKFYYQLSRKSEGANGISLPTFPFDLRFNYRESRRKIAPFCEIQIPT